MSNDIIELHPGMTIRTVLECDECGNYTWEIEVDKPGPDYSEIIRFLCANCHCYIDVKDIRERWKGLEKEAEDE